MGKRLPWQGAGWEQRLLALLQLQIIPRHKQPSGRLWLWLGWCGRKSVTLSLQPLCIQNSHLPPRTHPLSEHAHSVHTHVCWYTWLRDVSEGDGGSRWQLRVQEVEWEGGRNTALNIPGFMPLGKPTLGLQLFTPAA